MTAKDITVKLNAEGSVFVDASSVNDGSQDSCGEPITNFSLDKNIFTCDDLGDNAVVLTGTDSEGSAVTANATITVEPNVLLNQSTFSLGEEGSVTFDDTHLTGSTICDAVTYSISPASLDCSHINTWTHVTVTATYDAGTASFTRQIYLSDEVVPQAVTKDISVTIDETTGVASITPDMVDDGSSDNCAIASMTLSKSTFFLQ